ncbi:uncharacterized protein N7506_000476 [Penicillium brevicompactum]|uniref:uncharacterized protein n=1 Tax=Penicillium brevicompactum TaxID=5074 RepID=UPI002540798D|nr:uncharacterized protein N7506_000476 [Penicillium brevicompactum]KAJ5347223.1 hypothetical protein N7506_000476 [Penicillium brevicompactum]
MSAEMKEQLQKIMPGAVTDSDKSNKSNRQQFGGQYQWDEDRNGRRAFTCWIKDKSMEHAFY